MDAPSQATPAPASSAPASSAAREAASASSTLLRRIVLIYPLLLVLCGIGYAKYDNYQLDGDAVAFMDIADAMRAHNFALVPNGYWNPAYSAALAAGQAIAHPSRWTELQTFYWVNFWIFLGCIAACIYFVRSLALVREHLIVDSASAPALSLPALELAALALLLFSFERELNLGAVRSDALLLFFFFLAASFLLRIQSGGRTYFYALLGAALGVGYLTKSFAFLPAGFLLTALFVYGLTRKQAASGPGSRKRILTGTVLAGLIFAAIAAPYVVAISRQRGRPTTGESARMNYCFFVDQTDRWHEARTGKLGHATAHFLHPERVLLDSPPVYSYAQHPYGTYPLWFDPAYWTDTLQPRFWLHGEIARLVRCTALLVRYIAGHLEAFVLLGALLFAGCFYAKRRALWLPLLPVAFWGLLMLAIYFPVDLQDRYLTGPFLLVVLPALAMLRRRAEGARLDPSHIATTLAVLLAFLAVADAARDLGQRRRLLASAPHPIGAYSREIYGAAQGLTDLGLRPGQTVACFGDIACYLDHYWARLAETPIRAEIEVPDGSDPGRFWAAQTDQPQVVADLQQLGIAAIVANFAPSAHIPAGWQQLSGSNFYAFPIPASPH